uniref:Small auxin up regulated protein n=1 Tax=Kalanchoe fedtschenkoi TaxID=63787 RepID=A0A7N0U9N8_KALFE
MAKIKLVRHRRGWGLGKRPSKLFGKESPKKELLATGESSDGKRKKAEEMRKGFLAVYVGRELRRFEIPASYLSKPEFVELMEGAAQEFGFEQEGGLRVPCEEDQFEELLSRCMTMEKLESKSKRGIFI